MKIHTSKRRTVLVALAGASALTLGFGLAGCASGGGSGGTTELKIVLHSNAPTDAALKTITDKFEKANPDIKVKFEFVPIANWTSVRASRLAAKDVDITEGVTDSSAQPQPEWVKGVPESDWMKGVKAGNWVDLSNEPFLKNYTQTVVDAFKVDGKTYGAPTSLQLNNSVYYNKDIYAKYNLEVPTTWDQFVDNAKTLKKAGVTAIAMGGKTGWPALMPVVGLIEGPYPTADDKIALDKGLWTGTIKANDATNVGIMEKLKVIYGLADPNFPGVEYLAAEGQFASGQAAMTFDGTWAAASFLQQNPKLNLGVFPLPASNDTSVKAHMVGKVDGSFAIPSSSKHQAAAKKWLNFVFTPENYAVYVQKGGVISAMPDITPSDALKSFGDYLNDPFQLTFYDIAHANPNAAGNAANGIFNYAGLAPMGTFATPQEAQDATEKDWAAALPQ